jgi:Uma2 family endonuclease
MSQPVELLINPELKAPDPAQHVIGESAMSNPRPETYLEELEIPNIDHLVTEDDTPVDNLPSEKNQRLLVEPLYSSWKETNPDRKFLAAANIAVYYQISEPQVVPDMLLSLDVEPAADWWERKNRSYLVWEFGKPPDVVIEIVSNTVGNEGGKKLVKYAWMRAEYYAIFDPKKQISDEVLRVYELQAGRYVRREDWKLAGVQLGLTLWDGEFEGKQDTWLRWTDLEGNLIPTGKERADLERIQKESALKEKEVEKTAKEAALEKAETERLKAEKLAAKLKELGIDPEQV